MNNNEIILYQPDGSISLEVRVEDETVWLTQAQMSELFQKDRTVITRHINNIFKEGELDFESNVHFLHIANSDRPIGLYNLDVIISVGYRVKSKVGTQFRRWANSVLKDYILSHHRRHGLPYWRVAEGPRQEIVCFLQTRYASGMVGVVMDPHTHPVLPRHSSRPILSSCQRAAVWALLTHTPDCGLTAVSGVTKMSSLRDEGELHPSV